MRTATGSSHSKQLSYTRVQATIIGEKRPKCNRIVYDRYMFKRMVQQRLEGYVVRFLKAHPEVRVVVVTGSVGKTSTKVAIGTVLGEKLRVRMHEGNYNSEISAPLAMLGIELPDSLRNVSAWLGVFGAARRRITEDTDIDVIVQEIGSDRVGQVPHVARYLHPDLAVVTAVSPEHMEYFGTIEAVAAEELAAANFSHAALINQDDVNPRYAGLVTNSQLQTYGLAPDADYRFDPGEFTSETGYSGTIAAPEWASPADVRLHVLGEHSIRALVAAAAVGAQFGLTAKEVARGLAKVKPVKSRMQPLKGIKNSLLIDDTYNSSPLAAASALTTFYDMKAPQKIAVLGSMNELGEDTKREHEVLGGLCDPKKFNLLVTVGESAEKYLAPVAEKNGCTVKSFKSSIEAGEFLKSQLKSHAVVLFKGSEGGVFLEEALKQLLSNPADEAKLVRQTEAWQVRKRAFFDSL